MRTSKIFTDNLKKRIITMEMLELALYSINKRAKNCRDKKQEYYYKGKSSRYDKYFKSVEKYKEKEKEYYSQKDILLCTLLKPIYIHEESIKREHRIRYYDYEPEFENLSDKAVYENGYYDKEVGDYVEFIDIIEIEETKNYYLFYKTNKYSFHTPISEQIAKKSNIDIIHIEGLNTEGKEITELVSTQFVKKLMELVASKEYEFVNEECEIR
ncbi:hypothetical protein [Clostridium sp. ZS2-4]|uniref:hypothetical protein n=1 Tax=Clostridium sp. ZS2-4 TaxID=2987703 RepID=UPI00227C0DEC|nr:hypothetical protein [Clostridium sp. ZS2-4]MCY6354348.1 hypothetical protein [Clostridium sp. ZS2-4]